MSRVRGSLNASISGKTDQVSCVFGAQRIRCVWGKMAFSGIHELRGSFRSKFETMSLQGLHWLQKLVSGKALFGTKVV